MSGAFKPMLAASEVLPFDQIRYPMLGSFKLDGIRAIITPKGPRTRSLKEIPNHHIRALLSTLPAGLDGEIMAKDFRSTTTAVMREEGEPEFTYYVFDNYLTHGGFRLRHRSLGHLMLPAWIQVLAQHELANAEDAKALYQQALTAGHEGLIIRDPVGAYKFGRATHKDHGMLKAKPWKDDEATILEIVPAFKNNNEAKTNELGRTKRSSAKAGKVQMEKLGCFKVRMADGREFEVGTGPLTDPEKVQMWSERDSLVGKIIRFKYLDHGGYDVPRHAGFQGFRDPRDMS